MAGFQFMHSEVYAATAGQPRPAKKGGAVVRTEQRKLSAMAVIGEAARLDGCAPHVDQPQAPKTLFGIEAGSLANWCTDLLEMAANQVTVGGKKQRKDTPVLMGIVASFPGPPDDSDANYVRWKELNVSYFRQKFGDKVASILEHTDEKHGHLHVLLHNNGLSVKSLHPGYAASVPVRQAGGSQAAQSEAYKGACKHWQDEYHEQVAMRCGLARIGPGRQRLSRSQWLRQQQQSERLAKKLHELEEAEKRARVRELALDQVEKEKADRLAEKALGAYGKRSAALGVIERLKGPPKPPRPS